MIDIHELRKDYTIYEREKGFAGMIKSFIKPRRRIINAVQGISLKIEKGEIIGLIGPNGAGKSTIIKIMAGILVPTSGKVRINGIVPYKNRKENAKQIGVMFGNRTQLWPNLPLSDSLDLLRKIYDIPIDQYKKRLSFFDDVLGIHAFTNNPVRNLSLGQRMRGEITAAMIHNPEVIFLDEPTIGLDVVVKDDMLRAIKEINREKKATIILASHITGDIENICGRIVIIDFGKMVFEGEQRKLRGLYGSESILTVELERDMIVGLPPNCKLKKQNQKHLTIAFNKHNIAAWRILQYIADQAEIKDFYIKQPHLEDLIKDFYFTMQERTK